MSFTLDWDQIGSDGSQTLNENGQSVDVAVSTPRNAQGKEWFVENGMLKNWDVTTDSSADIRFSESVTNVKFTLLDVDALDKITIMTKDADGNPVPVEFEVTGVHHVNGSTVTGTQTNAPGPGADNNGQDIEVCIPGPLMTFWIVLDNGAERSYSGTVAVSDITFDLADSNLNNQDGYVDGTDGNDVIDVSYAGDPDGDKIDNNDQILPGEGPQDDVVLAGAGNDFVMAGAGSDEIYGGDGVDTLCGQDGDDTIYGGKGNDILEGMNGNDLLFGQDGNDKIYGDAGQDTAVGGLGDDTILGGADADKIYGGLGNDKLDGGTGDDMVIGGAGADSILGGSGNDTLRGDGISFNGKIDFNNLAAGDLVNGQYTANGLHIYSADPHNPVMVFDTAHPTGGDNDLATSNLGKVLILSEDRDGTDPDDNAGGGTFVFEFDGPAHVGSLDFLDIEGGAWIKMYDANGNLIRQIDTARTANNGQLHQGINTDGVVRMEVIIRGSGAIDNICYSLDGSAGDLADTIDGGAGDDYIIGGLGDDVMSGGTGNDVFDDVSGTDQDGFGNDTVFGGDGNDVAYTGVGNDTLFGGNDDDKLFGEGGDDVLRGDAGNDNLFGGAGNDDLDGGTGNDMLFGGDGDDTLSGGAGNDKLEASRGNDTLFGGDGEDDVWGGRGNDLLDGGAGADTINGGDDADIIIGGAGDVVDGGAGGNDFDTLDLTGKGPFYLTGPDGTGDPIPDSNGNGIDGKVIFIDADGNPTGEMINFTEIELVVGDQRVQNVGPEAADDDFAAGEDDAPGVIGNVLDNDTDANDDPLVVSEVNGDPAGVGQPVAGDNGGLITINPDGTVSFDPNGDFEALGEGEEATTTITYTVDDGNGGTEEATVTITVTGVNDGPDARDNAYTVGQDEGFGDVDGNALTDDTGAGVDSDPEGDTLTVTAVGGVPGNVGTPVAAVGGGLVTINADGSIDFDANGEFDALGEGEETTATITYTISDGNGGTDEATVTFTITGTNDGPVAVADDLAAGEDDPAGVIGNVLDNDTDPDGDELDVFKVGGDEANLGQPTAGDNGGLITIGADGTVTFDPNGDFDALGEGETATTTITYMVRDPSGAMATETVSITVTGTNDDPTAVMDTYTAPEDGVTDLGNVLGNDTDPDGDTLTVTDVNGAPAGTPVAGDNGGLITINPDGSISFDPDGAFDDLGEGEEATTQVTYTISDGNGGTDEATVTITVTGTNDAPVAVRNDYVARFDEAAGDVDGNVLTDDTGDGVDSDPEGDDLTVVGVGAPDSGVGVPVAGDNGGLFTILADGTVDFDANGDFDDLGLNDTRTTTVTYTIADENGATSTAVATFTVGGVNDGTVQGTDGDDIINPDIPYVDADGDIVDGNDAILPGETGNDDLILGFGGNDSIDAGDGNDRVFGGEGNDTIDGGAGNDGLVGDDGDDIIEGNDGDDMIFGNDGNDQLFGGAGMDKLEGGIGDDLLEGGDGDDDLWAGAGNDRVLGGDGNDVIDGGSGNDELLGNAGNDTINGASGDDTIRGGQGDDSLDGSFGNDSIVGGEGSDVIEGGNGNDIIDAGNHVDPAFDNPYPGLGAPDADPDDDKDLVFGGLGNDIIRTGDDADTIFGGAGNDVIDAGIDDDSVSGGTGDDTIIGGQGVDLIEGNDGNDVIYGGLEVDLLDLPDRNPDGSQNDLLPDDNIDTIFGGAGNDTIFGRDDADVLFGGTGNDVIDGGVDDDQITGGEGVDQLFGGQGSDTFFGGNGGDNVVGGEDAPSAAFPDGADIDVLDLTGSNVVGIDYDPNDPEAGTVRFADGSTMTFSEIENVIPCFTPGTAIATPKGERLVEELQVGDKIITRDNGIQEIAWVGHKAMTGKQLAANPHLKPILIKAGSLGQGLPERDMLVSPNHRVLVASEKTQLYFEEREVLAAAKHMVGAEGIHAVNVMSTTYVHFMFERHEVVLSNGAWTESFQPGDYSLKGIGNSQRNEIFELFPELATKTGLEGYQAARKALKKHEARLLTMQ